MKTPARVQSVDRALSVLELLENAGRDGKSLAGIAMELGLSRSATWTMLQTLLTRSYIAESTSDGRSSYTLGMSLARLGHKAQGQMRLNDVAAPYLRSLAEKTRLTSRLAVLHGTSAIVIAREDAEGAVQFNLHMGQPELLHSSSVGKALLSAMPDESVRTLLTGMPLERKTSRTITSIDDLIASLPAVRRRGYSVDDEEDAEGVVCVGAAILDHRFLPVGGVSVTGLKQALPLDRIEEVGTEVASHARAISNRLAPGRKTSDN